MLSLVRARHRLSQGFQAHFACPGKGMVKHIDQKQDRSDHDSECGGEQVLRLNVFHSEEKSVGHREHTANK